MPIVLLYTETSCGMFRGNDLFDDATVWLSKSLMLNYVWWVVLTSHEATHIYGKLVHIDNSYKPLCWCPVMFPLVYGAQFIQAKCKATSACMTLCMYSPGGISVSSAPAVQ